MTTTTGQRPTLRPGDPAPDFVLPAVSHDGTKVLSRHFCQKRGLLPQLADARHVLAVGAETCAPATRGPGRAQRANEAS